MKQIKPIIWGIAIIALGIIFGGNDRVVRSVNGIGGRHRNQQAKHQKESEYAFIHSVLPGVECWIKSWLKKKVFITQTRNEHFWSG